MQLELVPMGQPGMAIDGQHVLSLKTQPQLEHELALVNAGNYQVVTRNNQNQTVVAPSNYMQYLKVQLQDLAKKQQAQNAKQAVKTDEKTKDALILTLRQRLTETQSQLHEQDVLIEKLLTVAKQSELALKHQNQSPLLSGANPLLMPNRRLLVSMAQDVDDDQPLKIKIDRLLNVLVANDLYTQKDAEKMINDEYGDMTYDHYLGALSKPAIDAKLAQIAKDVEDNPSNADTRVSGAADAGEESQPNPDHETAK